MSLCNVVGVVACLCLSLIVHVLGMQANMVGIISRHQTSRVDTFPTPGAGAAAYSFSAILLLTCQLACLTPGVCPFVNTLLIFRLLLQKKASFDSSIYLFARLPINLCLCLCLCFHLHISACLSMAGLFLMTNKTGLIACVNSK